MIDAVLSGDERVAREFHDRLLPVIERSIRHVLRAHVDRHHDLVQIAFEQVITTLFRNKFARACSLKTWAGRIASRVALQALRDQYRERRTTGDYPERSATADDDRAASEPSGSFDPERQADARAQLQWVQHQLAIMSPKRAEVLLLHEFEGYELGEIALMMGISVASAQSLLVRAHRQLLTEYERQASRAQLRSKVTP